MVAVPFQRCLCWADARTATRTSDLFRTLPLRCILDLACHTQRRHTRAVVRKTEALARILPVLDLVHVKLLYRYCTIHFFNTVYALIMSTIEGFGLLRAPPRELLL